MKPVTVLDTSAVLVFLQGEPGEDVVRQALQDGSCVVSAANPAEIIAKCLDRGGEPETIKLILTEFDDAVVDVAADDGAQAGRMRHDNRNIGLSLGDRLCLAGSRRLKARVLTADRPSCALAPLWNLEIFCIHLAAH